MEFLGTATQLGIIDFIFLGLGVVGMSICIIHWVIKR